MAAWADRQGSLAAGAVLAALLLAGLWVAFFHSRTLLFVPGELAPRYAELARHGLVCRAAYREPVATSLAWRGGEFDVALTRPQAWMPWLEWVAYRVTLPQTESIASTDAACELVREIAARKLAR